MYIIITANGRLEIHQKTPLAEKYGGRFWVLVSEGMHEQPSAKMQQSQTRNVFGFYAFGVFT